MLPLEIYIAILVASSCIVLLSVSFLIAAVYFKVRINALEHLVTQIDGGFSGLIDETHDFATKMKRIAARGQGVMDDVGQMTRTARAWTDCADQMVDVVTRATDPSAAFVSKHFRFESGLLNGVLHRMRAKDTNHSPTRKQEMSECNNGSPAQSSTPKVMAAFGAGALIGVGVALLFAPQSGKETRDKVVSKTQDFKDTAEDVIDRGKHLAHEVKNETREVFEKGKKAARETSVA